MAKIEKPETIKLNLMRGPTDKEKQITAKLKSGLIEYNGMDPQAPIIYFGQPGYALYDVRSKKLELFYDPTRKKLMKLKELGGTPAGDAIADLTTNFTIAAKNTEANMGVNTDMNSLGKWTLGIIFVVALVAMIFIYMMASHGTGTPSATQSITNSISSQTLVHIPT